MMELRFEGDQQFQLDAIEAIAELFDGQGRAETDLVLADSGFAAVANRLDLDDEQLAKNLRVVQERASLPVDDALGVIEQAITTTDGDTTARFFNFSVEMETGTGKTY